MSIYIILYIESKIHIIFWGQERCDKKIAQPLSKRNKHGMIMKRFHVHMKWLWKWTYTSIIKDKSGVWFSMIVMLNNEVIQHDNVFVEPFPISPPLQSRKKSSSRDVSRHQVLLLSDKNPTQCLYKKVVKRIQKEQYIKIRGKESRSSCQLSRESILATAQKDNKMFPHVSRMVLRSPNVLILHYISNCSTTTLC